MAALRDSVYDTILRHRMLSSAAPLAVAVSGGPDSLSLLHVLAALRDKLACELHVIHLDHMLRGAESAAEAAFVAETAARLGIPATIEAIAVRELATERRLNTHAAARAARYGLLARTALAIGAQAVATAHHADDQAETVLLHLIRGAGVEGLRAMRPVVPWEEWAAFAAPTDPALAAPPAPLPLIRPMLGVSRATIEAYCAEQGLMPRHDPSNADRRYLRTRVRQEILPALAALNPRIVDALGHTAAACAAAADLIDYDLDQVWHDLVIQQETQLIFDGPRWAKLPPALRQATLRRGYTLLGGGDTLAFGDIDRATAIIGGQVGKRIEWPGGIILTTSYHGAFSISRGSPHPPHAPQLAQERISLPVPGIIDLGHGYRIHAVRCTANIADNVWEAYLNDGASDAMLIARRRRPGDRMRPDGRGSRRLQDIMLDARIPRESRAEWPVIASGDRIVWLPGIAVDQAYVAAEGDDAIHLRMELP